MVQERVDGLRASMSDGKRNIGVLTERVQTLQSELTQSQLRRSELEAELHNTQEVRSNRPKAGSRRRVCRVEK